MRGSRGRRRVPRGRGDRCRAGRTTRMDQSTEGNGSRTSLGGTSPPRRPPSTIESAARRTREVRSRNVGRGRSAGQDSTGHVGEARDSVKARATARLNWVPTPSPTCFGEARRFVNRSGEGVWSSYRAKQSGDVGRPPGRVRQGAVRLPVRGAGSTPSPGPGSRSSGRRRRTAAVAGPPGEQAKMESARSLDRRTGHGRSVHANARADGGRPELM